MCLFPRLHTANGNNGTLIGPSVFAQLTGTRVFNTQTTLRATCVGKGRIYALLADEVPNTAPKMFGDRTSPLV